MGMQASVTRADPKDAGEISADELQTPEIGLSHVALSVRDVDTSVAFYERFAGMREVHRRNRSGRRVVWLSDLSRPFVIVLIEVERVEGRLDGIAHLGIGCASKHEVDDLCDLARSESRLVLGPDDAGQPVGYWALLRDPDGHNLEISFGQEVALAVDQSKFKAQAAQPREEGQKLPANPTPSP